MTDTDIYICRLVWEQNVRVIVMLTRQYEGPDVKCGKYWADGRYGPLRLKLISETGASAEVDPIAGASGFNFQFPIKSKQTPPQSPDDNYTVRRVFELSNDNHPKEPSRIVRHYQYLAWPDMNVPSNPRGVLRLIREVDDAVDRSNEETGSTFPTLLHCSAGVGRTGSFIVLDAVLDGVRRELRRRFLSSSSSESETSSEQSSDVDGGPIAMDIDNKSLMTPPLVRASVQLGQKPSTSSAAVLANAPSYNQEVLHTKSGMVATLHVGSSAVAGRGADIHVPLVPSSTRTVSTLAQRRVAHPAGWQASVSTQPLNIPQPAPTLPDSNGAIASTRKNLSSEFTAADADLMFTGSALNPAFAMDVENNSLAVQRHTSNGSSSEYPPNNDSLSIMPIAAALARLSSSDDVPGRTQRLDSEFTFRKSPRDRTCSGSGSGSGEAGWPNKGGYSSSSSVLHSGVSQSGSSGSTRVTFAPSVPKQPSMQHRTHTFTNKASQSSLDEDTPRLGGHHRESSGKLQQQEKPAPSLKSIRHYRSSSSSAPSVDAMSPLMSPTPYQSSETAISTNSDSRSLTPPEKHPAQVPIFKLPSDYSPLDYSIPRELHREDSPPLLSSFEDPVREILEDMRQQRMSLCQSLRQYVFVHSAVIEGSLQILDEEVEKATKAGIFSSGSGSTSVSSFIFHTKETSPLPTVTVVHSTGKRGASPTELPKEGKQGEVVLSKRPSLKRGKSSSSGGSGESSPIAI